VNTTVNIIQRQLIITTVVLLALALIISFIISRTLTKPILRIEKATKRIAEGDYSVKLDVDSNDEIGSLAESVNDMAAELSRTDELRKDLIANVSHDLRTPLSLIRGYAETLRDVTGDNKEKRERQLGIIIDETERLDRIVSDMLDLSKLQSGSITVSPAPFDVRRAFGDIISRYDDLSAKSGVTAAAECEDGLSAVGDLPRLEQVFYNLINNAFNHTKEGGKITLAAAKNGELIRFSVTDTGSGISKEDLPHIFDRYYKGEAGVRKIVGTGLGLAIVKNILEAHHAVYGVDSTVGVGTTFWFDLPAAEK
ncbi:MAG: HAMP domain-containing protein, partial [Clostridia bacterium]|nr:HAMP domain-containing protein [Clostridia bacterium]